MYNLLVAGAVALATFRRYSFAQTAAFTSFAFFLSSSDSNFYGVSAVPAYNLGIRSESGNHFMEPWEQPCGTPLGAASLKKSPPRHSVHRALKRVRIQLRVAQNHFRKDLKFIHDIYSKVYKVLKGQYHLSWLPKNQLEWYYKELWCLEKSKKAEYALPRLHDALQRFAITFHSLKLFRFESNINVEYIITKRNEIINEMQNEVLRMLCEVETAILNLGLQLPKIHKMSVVTDSTDWATEGDLTLMLIQDWGVLRLYQAFLNDWIRAFKNATAIGSGTCDPSLIKPLVYYPKHRNPKRKRIKAKKIAQLRERSKSIDYRYSRNNSESASAHMNLGTNSHNIRTKKKSIRRRFMKNRRKKILQ